MARPLRIEYPGAFYHITTRGVGRQDIFFDEADRQMFLEKLGEVQEKWGLVVHGYCLMSNHYHLEVETLEGNISRSMQPGRVGIAYHLFRMYAGNVCECGTDEMAGNGLVLNGWW